MGSFGQFYHVPAHVIQARVAEMAATRGVSTVPEATIIGFTPEEAHRVAVTALSEGSADYWKTRSTARFM